MKSLVVLSMVTALIVPSLALGGGAANPASTVGREIFGFGFEYEAQKKVIDDDLATSQRGIGKVIWGVRDWADIYIKLGASNLQVAVAGAQDYEGKRGMTWGGGGRLGLTALEQPKIRAYLDVQMLTFYTDGTVWREFEDGYTEKYADRYKWNEVQVSCIAVWDRPYFMPYLGVGITNVFGNVTKDVTGGPKPVHEAYDFREDAIAEAILGLEFPVAGTARVGCEMRYSVDEDISFSIGASELWQVK